MTDTSQIRKFLKSSDDNFRMIGLQMLQKSPNKEEFVDELLSLLNDENPDVRSFAVEMLAEIKDKDVLSNIVKLITDEQKAVKLSVLGVLTKNPSEEYISYIIPLTKDPEIAVRRAALRALSTISSFKILDAVIKSTTDTSDAVATDAKEIVANYNGNVPSSFIQDYINHPNSSIRSIIIEFLVEKADSEPIKHYLRVLKDPVEDIRALSLSKIRDFVANAQDVHNFQFITKDIIPLLNDPSKKVRFQALGVLQELQDGSTIEHLISVATNDPDEDVRRLAMDVIVTIRRSLRLE